MRVGACLEGGAPLPRGHLKASLASTPSLLDFFHSKNNFYEGFIPFGFHLVFLFFERNRQKQ